MTELALAYGILSDPDKRKRFDDTGQTEPDNIQALVYAEFCRMCEEILLKQEGLPLRQNVDRFRSQVENGYNGAKSDISKQRKILDAAKARIIRVPEIDPLNGVISQRLDDLVKKEEDLEKQISIARQALAMFDQYEIMEPELIDTFGKVYVSNRVPWQI